MNFSYFENLVYIVADSFKNMEINKSEHKANWRKVQKFALVCGVVS
jgi:hypothetical protein